MIVIDASVFNKLFLKEDDRCLQNDIEMIAPDILPYEAMSAAIRFGVPFGDVFRILATQRSVGLRLIALSSQILILAEKIASTGHAKSGYPDVYDSIYHALALDHSGTFITADRRHFAKAKQYGAVELLENWRGIVTG